MLKTQKIICVFLLHVQNHYGIIDMIVTIILGIETFGGLMEKVAYATKQKEQLLSFFQNNPNHCFSSKQLLEATDIEMGEATIYRHLARFTKQGVLIRFVGDGDKKIYYQLNCNHRFNEHFHLKCLKCGMIFHSDCVFMKDLKEHIEEHHSFCIDNTKTVLYGLCSQCKPLKKKG